MHQKAYSCTITNGGWATCALLAGRGRLNGYFSQPGYADPGIVNCHHSVLTLKSWKLLAKQFPHLSRLLPAPQTHLVQPHRGNYLLGADSVLGLHWSDPSTSKVLRAMPELLDTFLLRTSELF